MDLKTFELLARYNLWATQKLNQTLLLVSDDDFFLDQGLYFKSIFGTLNHLLVGEHHLLFPRFALHHSPILPLDSIVETNRTQLVEQLEKKAENWIYFLNQVDEKVFHQELHYKTSTGVEMHLPYAATLMHVFNHATHHRGQITAALTAMGYVCPELDLIYMLLEDKAKKRIE